jgi:hypothetical protein
MSDTEPAGQRFVLRPPPPVRALGIASVSVVVGAVLVVLWGEWSRPLILVLLAVILMAAGVALASAALVIHQMLCQTVIVAETGITVLDRRARRTLSWSSIGQVSVIGPRLLLRNDGDPVKIINSRGPTDPVFVALVSAITLKLDADRGYRNL